MNVIITGASRGIGHAVAEAFLSHPGHVVGITARSAAPLEQLATNAAGSSRAIPYPFDLTGGKIHDLTQAIARDFNKVDLLINNAGYLVNKPFTDLGREDYLKSLEINFLAPVFLIKGLLPLLERSEIGHIVNIGSMAGFQGITKIAGLAAYSASKAAINNISELLGVELAGKGIRVNALAPGSVDTEMIRLAIPGYKAAVIPDEMAEFIYAFATTAWKVVSGKVIPVALTVT
jgi:NAD(P)-dependent dehydrogenase (short-subunit alcohol dehydrogenase family)